MLLFSSGWQIVCSCITTTFWPLQWIASHQALVKTVVITFTFIFFFKIIIIIIIWKFWLHSTAENSRVWQCCDNASLGCVVFNGQRLMIPTWCICTWVQRPLVQRQAPNSQILSLWGRLWPQSQPGCAASMNSRAPRHALWLQSPGQRDPGPQRSYLEQNASEKWKKIQRVAVTMTKHITILTVFSPSYIYAPF